MDVKSHVDTKLCAQDKILASIIQNLKQQRLLFLSSCLEKVDCVKWYGIGSISSEPLNISRSYFYFYFTSSVDD